MSDWLYTERDPAHRLKHWRERWVCYLFFTATEHAEGRGRTLQEAMADAKQFLESPVVRFKFLRWVCPL